MIQNQLLKSVVQISHCNQLLANNYLPFDKHLLYRFKVISFYNLKVIIFNYTLISICVKSHQSEK